MSFDHINNIDVSSSSYDSDDDFLINNTTNNVGHSTETTATTSKGSTEEDREALVRKKLLENFYGVVAPATTGTTNTTPKVSSTLRRTNAIDSTGGGNDIGNDDREYDNMDSKHFDTNRYLQQHIRSSSTHTLLEIEERLALQIRTLDSTMQTLVYENYLKFIHVTDAIKSIGTNVTVNEKELNQLIDCTTSMDTISHTILDNTIGTIRDTIVDKIRTQRLLQRLNTLLTLPQTLQSYISTTTSTTPQQPYQYQKAVQLYISSIAILQKHSTIGFESLKSIEMDCNTIVLQQLYAIVQRKIFHWSGTHQHQRISTDVDLDNDNDFDYDPDLYSGSKNEKNQMETYNFNKNNINNDDAKYNDDDDDLDVVPDPPKSIMEIFECAGAYCTLKEYKKKINDDATAITGNENNNSNHEDTIYTMTFHAVMRYIDRLLDAHSIQVQEYMFTNQNNQNSNSVMVGVTSSTNLLGNISERSSTTTTNHDDHNNHSSNNSDYNENQLIPRNVLVAILDSATLFQTTFTGIGNNNVERQNTMNYYLIEFITDAFTAFTSHVRTILLEESLYSDTVTTTGATNTTESDGNEMNRSLQEGISNSLTVLVQYVQEMTIGLTNIGLNSNFTNQLLHQTIRLTESMIHRRVDKKFHTLRYSIINDCLFPFTQQLVLKGTVTNTNTSTTTVTDDEGDTTPNIVVALPEMVQLAKRTLSDCLQLIDDTIRSILADSSSSSSSSVAPATEVMEAVRNSTIRFLSWLANAFEIIAGGNPTDYNHIAEATMKIDQQQTDNIIPLKFTTTIGDASEDGLLLLLYKSRESLMLQEKESDDFSETIDDNDAAPISTDSILSMIELCRLSETLIPNGLQESLTSDFGTTKKKASRDMFPSTEEGTKVSSKTLPKTSPTLEDDVVSQRFRLAGSRIFMQFIMNSGTDALSYLCKDMSQLAMLSDDDTITGPSSGMLHVVSYAKKLSIDCATLFGGTKRAGPVPIWDDSLIMNSNDATTFLSTAAASRKSGLFLDVERMFKEVVTIYPHPSEILPYTRNTAIYLFFKMVLRGWYETLRSTITTTFTYNGCVQIQIDVLFLKYMIPHYLSSEYSENSTNGCTALYTLIGDVNDIINERYASSDDMNHIQNEARNIVRSFTVTIESDTVLSDRFIIKES